MSDAFVVPAGFARIIVRQHGVTGERWLDRLPGLVVESCRRWRTQPTGEVWHGNCGVVVAVHDGTVPAVLKISWLDDRTRWEAAALRIWDGRGAVRLIASAGAGEVLLIERLDASRSLSTVPEAVAVASAAALLRRLAVPAPDGVPQLVDLAAEWRRTLPDLWRESAAPFPRRLVDRAVGLAAELASDLSSRPVNLLVNCDLHYANVLAGDREPWLAIDPKIVAGDLEFGVCPLLWNRAGDPPDPGRTASRLAAVVEIAGLDRDRAQAWSFVRAVEYWLHAVRAGYRTDLADVVVRAVSPG